MLRPSVHRSDLLLRWHAARAETDALFGLIRPECLFERPISERHRLAFYIGHLEAFDWNLIGLGLGLVSAQPELDRLFAFGIDPIEGNLPSDLPADWPPLADFLDYRQRVRVRLDAAMRNVAQNQERDRQLDHWLHVAIEHRQMHAETLSYLLHQLPFAMKINAPHEGPAQTPAPQAQTIAIPAGTATLGLSASSGEFGWDNEFEAHSVDVPAFAIDKFKVSNADYLRFVQAGGYERREFWSAADWDWKTAHRIAHPAFWIRDGEEWFWRSMFEPTPLPLARPVYVSQAEANAYAQWSGRALPTEAQWQRAAFADGDSEDYAGIDRPMRDLTQNAGFNPLPVDSDALVSPSPFGLIGLHGNGWEWTSTVFAPFGGFRIFDSYPGYSQPFFDGRHFVLKGGSVRTASAMLRPSFRNWFQAHYPYVYAGFRCVDIVPRSVT
jgi:iron(II)-dependent oxidoreductase